MASMAGEFAKNTPSQRVVLLNRVCQIYRLAAEKQI